MYLHIIYRFMKEKSTRWNLMSIASVLSSGKCWRARSHLRISKIKTDWQYLTQYATVSKIVKVYDS